MWIVEYLLILQLKLIRNVLVLLDMSDLSMLNNFKPQTEIKKWGNIFIADKDKSKDN